MVGQGALKTAAGGGGVLRSSLGLGVAIAAALAAQGYFLFSADDVMSPAGFYLAANVLVVAGMSLAAAVSPHCPRRARRPLAAAAAVFALMFAHTVLWTAESWLEDAAIVALWVVAALTLTTVARLPATPPLIRRLLVLAVALQGVAITADLLGDGVLGGGAGGAMEWLDLAGTLASMAAYQLALLHVVAEGGVGAAVRHAAAFFAEGGALRRSVGVASDVGFQAWKSARPEGTYAQFYAERIERRLDLGLSHKTLGGRVYMSEGLASEARTFDTDDFRASGALYFDWFRSRALRADMTCVDIGCGSLRVGQHFIRYLEPGRYVGLDVVERFYRDGLKLIEPETIAAKRPHFGTIRNDELARAAALRPDLVYSTAVLQHVPPEELDVYLARLIGLIADNGVVMVNFKVAAKLARPALSNWVHEPSRLFDTVARVDGGVHAVVLPGRSPSISDQATLIIARDPARIADWARRPQPLMRPLATVMR